MKSFYYYMIIGITLLVLTILLVFGIVLNFEDIAWDKPFLTIFLTSLTMSASVVGLLLTVIGVLDMLEYKREIKKENRNHPSGQFDRDLPF